MKKLLVLLLIGVSCTIYNCLALNRFSMPLVEVSDMSDLISEEVNPVYDNGYIVGFDLNIVIPDNYDSDFININSSVIDGISNYKKLIPGEEVFININIVNNSNYDYSYVNGSFLVVTDDFSKYSDSNNYNRIGTGFDGKIIYDKFSVNRVYNDAIESLYNDSYKEKYLSDEYLDKKLKKIGYSINEIDKYYLNYYNNKYNLKETDLNNFTYSTIKEMFNGEISTYKEKNNNINLVAYNYFYNKLFYVLDEKQEIDQFESDNYSVSSYMKKDKSINLDDISSFDSSSKKIKVGINDYYYTDLFDEYPLSIRLVFKYKKSDYIKAPNTGV